MERVTLVTGASSGIGEGIAKRLIETGRSVLTIQRTAPKWQNEKLHFLPCDLADADATRRVAARAVSEFEVDGIVNNAGHGSGGLVADQDLQALSRLFAVHVHASLLLTQAVLPGMRRRRYGRIVNLGSRSMLGRKGRTGYAAAKASLMAMTRVWAMELGPHGITCNMVAPGPIDTPMIRRNNPQSPPHVQNLINASPVRRIGTAEDVAHAVEFFLSERAGYITGQVLYVCGGLSLGSSPI
jgi:3-oxoacyl-[acyl-carrier protein] reductase